MDDEDQTSDRPSRKRTLQGMPSVPPESGGDEPRPLGRRVSLSFDGPPLALPGEATDSHGEEPELQLDTSELGEGTGDPGAGDPRLELDLEGFDEQGVAAAGHDGWTAAGASRAAASADASEGEADSASARGRAVRPPMSPAPGVPDQAGALDLVDRCRTSVPPADLDSEMRERFALDDFSGALRAAELLLGRDPDHAEARRYADGSRHKLEQHLSSRLGGLAGRPVVAVRSSEVRWLGLDHRAGFLLSRIDGEHTVEDILDVSGMPRLEALKVLSELLEAGAIRIDGNGG
ncbi:MAG: hypothetical protein ACOC97_05755 [Myxococcota bacterium]